MKILAAVYIYFIINSITSITLSSAKTRGRQSNKQQSNKQQSNKHITQHVTKTSKTLYDTAPIITVMRALVLILMISLNKVSDTSCTSGICKPFFGTRKYITVFRKLLLSCLSALYRLFSEMS